ncbi:MAG: 3-oxoacyl-[acyl-carrier protein] reductase [Planctomycetota bacterium]|jgi:3-oxoacyl-[acyl-carrier protein] reductase
MNNRVALVTGAARGLGRAVVERMLEEGFAVYLADARQDLLEITLEELKDYTSSAEGRLVEGRVSDVRDQAACEAAVSACVETFGRLDVLVNCAGVYPRAEILSISKEDWHFDLDINVLGTYFMMAAAVRAMKSNPGGYIVNISSIDAFTAHEHNAHYAASKAAVVSLTRSFAVAFAGVGIMVNSVAPGPLATEAAKTMGWYDDMVASLPTRHPIEPVEIADAVVYLSRSQNKSITGEQLIVSGGLVLA